MQIILKIKPSAYSDSGHFGDVYLFRNCHIVVPCSNTLPERNPNLR